MEGVLREPVVVLALVNLTFLLIEGLSLVGPVDQVISTLLDEDLLDLDY